MCCGKRVRAQLPASVVVGCFFFLGACSTRTRYRINYMEGEANLRISARGILLLTTYSKWLI